MESHEVEEIKRHFDVIAEGLRGDIKTIAEGHSILNRKLDGVQKEITTLREENAKEHKELHQEITTLREENAEEHKELHREIDNLRGENTEEHKEILSELKLSYAELNHRVSTLENK